MEVQVQLGEGELAKSVELDSVPRKGERIVHDGEAYNVTTVVHRIDAPGGVVVIAEPTSDSDKKEVWFR